MSLAATLDENLARAPVDLLRQAGYDADRVYEEGLLAAADERVWEHVCAEGQLFVTLDLDFSDVRRCEPGTHPGILLIRARSRSATAVTEVLARVIAKRSLDDLSAASPSPTSPLPEFVVHRRGIERCTSDHS
jgi:predicted nuclease of predicted toxin-antitoxin system